MAKRKLSPRDVERLTLLRQEQKQRKEEGLCVDCGDEAVPGRLRCRTHLLNNKRKTMERRERLRAEGLCGYCGVRPYEHAEAGLKVPTCTVCRERVTQRTQQWWVQRKAVAKAKGLCVQCLLEPSTPGTLYENCREDNRDRSKGLIG